MIRYSFLQHKMLQLYKELSKIEYPMNPDLLFKLLPNCRIMSYQSFAQLNACSTNDVILLCESKSGCTHYDFAKDRYLVLINESNDNHNVNGRILWTKAHELGHVASAHLPSIALSHIAENGFNNLTNPIFEAEADYFASIVLAPMPLYEILKISSYLDIRYVFGLSHEAAVNQWNSYLKWKQSHRKTAWENDMKRLYKERS